MAGRLRITRQAVYRYFPTRRALFEVVAAAGQGALVGRLVSHLRGIDDPADAGAEVVFWLLQAVLLDPSTATRRHDDRRFLAACLRPSVPPSTHPSTIRK